MRERYIYATVPASSNPLTSKTLIDKYLPLFDVVEHHETRVHAEPALAYEAFRSVDLNRSPIVRILFAIRGLPSRFRKGTRPPSPSVSFLDDALAVGWKVLEEQPGREIVVGAVTQPWAPVVRFRGLPGPDFIEFAEPGFTKIVWSIAARPADAGFSLLSTETRVAATDAASRRRFRRYWFLVNLGVRLIRIAALRLVKRELERDVASSEHRAEDARAVSQE